MQHINHAEVIINFWYFDIATLYVRRPYMSDDPICQVALPTPLIYSKNAYTELNNTSSFIIFARILPVNRGS